MKILELTNGFPTKEDPLRGIFEWDQSVSLEQSGEDVCVCAFDMRSLRHKRKFGIHKKEENNISIYKCDFPLGRVPYFIINFISWQMFKSAYRELVKTFGVPDIIHAHFARVTGYVALKAKQKYGIDYIITEHDSSINNDDLSNKEKTLVKNIYSNAKNRVGVSPTFCNRLKNIYQENFCYIPNIVDTDAYKTIVPVKHEGITIVSVGNLLHGKGMDLLLTAFSKITDATINKLIIIGEGHEKENLQNLARDLKIDNKVLFTGQLTRDEIAQKFAISDMFVLASRSETFGVVYIEAMYAGLPIVATKCGGPEGLIPTFVGEYAENDNVDSLADCILKVANNIDQYNKDKIKRYSADNFSPAYISQQIKELMK